MSYNYDHHSLARYLAGKSGEAMQYPDPDSWVTPLDPCCHDDIDA
jgi:hypothetical protein